MSGSRETTWKESPERGRMPCEIRDVEDKIMSVIVLQVSPKRLLGRKCPTNNNKSAMKVSSC